MKKTKTKFSRNFFAYLAKRGFAEFSVFFNSLKWIFGEVVAKSWNCCRKKMMSLFFLQRQHWISYLLPRNFRSKWTIDSKSIMRMDGDGVDGRVNVADATRCASVKGVCTLCMCHVNWLDMGKDISFRNSMQMLLLFRFFFIHLCIVFHIIESFSLLDICWLCKLNRLVGGHFEIAFLCIFFVFAQLRLQPFHSSRERIVFQSLFSYFGGTCQIRA